MISKLGQHEVLESFWPAVFGHWRSHLFRRLVTHATISQVCPTLKVCPVYESTDADFLTKMRCSADGSLKHMTRCSSTWTA